jgi:hypothetical protein
VPEILIHQALTKGSDFPTGDYNVVMWFDGGGVPDSAMVSGDDADFGHRIEVPESWSIDLGESGDDAILLGPEGAVMEAWDAFLAACWEEKGFKYLVEAEVPT